MRESDALVQLKESDTFKKWVGNSEITTIYDQGFETFIVVIKQNSGDNTPYMIFRFFHFGDRSNWQVSADHTNITAEKVLELLTNYYREA